jgi:MFS family permease
MTRAVRFSADYWFFLAGQTISSFGNAITAFALPLLVFELTGSALELSVTTAVVYLPYALFGLVIGAWVDRVNRKQLMVAADVVRAVSTATVPLAAALHVLSPWWVYAVTFLNSTLGIAFNSAAFAAVPFLGESNEELPRANSRLQASFSGASLLGPLVGGAALVVVGVADVLAIDAATYLVSAISLLLVRRRFDSGVERRASTVRADVVEGLRYVLGNAVLRGLALMAALINLFLASTLAQVVLLAKERMHASNPQVGWFYSAAPLGMIVFSLAAPRLRRLGSFGRVAIAATILNGLSTLALSQSRSLIVGLAAYAVLMGTVMLFTVSTATLRQQITPPDLLGRVISTAMVLAWSVEPVGAVLGGAAVERTGRVDLVYAVSGIALVAIGVVFAAGPLGRSEPPSRLADSAVPAPAARWPSGASR